MKELKKQLAIIIFAFCTPFIIYHCLLAIANNSENFGDSDQEVPITLLSKESIIEFSGDKVIVTDTNRINVDDNVEDKYFTYDLKIISPEDMEYVPKITNVVYDNKLTSIVVDEKDVVDDGVRHKNSILLKNYRGRVNFWTDYLGLQENGEHTLEITYEYDMEKVVTEYDDVCTINIDGGYEKSKFVLPKDVNDIKSKAIGIKVEKLTNNSYRINPTIFGSLVTMFNDNNIYIVLEKNVLTDGKMMDGKFEEIYRQNVLQKLTNNISFIDVAISLIFTFTIFIVSCILVKKPKFENKYIRDTELVLDAVLSENLVDGKIGAKELIMTSILSAINKGAIETQDNDTIKLIKYDGLNSREKEIVDLIFTNLGDKVSFDDIKNIFIDDNIKTRSFYEKFSKIKTNIINELYEKNIYNIVGDYILKIIRITAALITVNSIMFFSERNYENVYHENLFYLIFMNIATIVIVVRKIISEYQGETLKLENGKDELFCIMLFVGLLLENGFAILERPLVLAIVSIICFINYKTYKNSKHHVLTPKGKEEYVKVLGLKKYIEDYSMMKERDMDEVITWDNYLVYAIAFGIPNKITNRFDDSSLNSNINMQKLISLLLPK